MKTYKQLNVGFRSGWVQCAIIAIAFSFPATSFGQNRPVAGKLDVTLVSMATLPTPGGRAVVIRRNFGAERNIIAVTSSSTLSDLAGAFAALENAFRKDQGVLPAPEHRMSIGRTSFSVELKPNERNHFEKMIAQLSTAPSREIRGLGSQRAISVAYLLTPLK